MTDIDPYLQLKQSCREYLETLDDKQLAQKLKEIEEDSE